MELLRPFSHINKEDVSIAGGKGASLGEMTMAKIPVPSGFVILSSSFERFIEETDLNVEIDSILGKVSNQDMSSIENASEKIQALIMNSKMPKDIEKEITVNFKKLNSEFVAVRSSATSEDSAAAAWAGQLDSFLNTKENTLLVNVKKCWASLFTPRAIFYRFEKGLEDTKISVAVVIQKMVNSEISGIAFSVHPVTQDRNQLIIEAGLGLGEAIVSGQITPDSYVVEKSPRKIIDKNVAEQKRGLFKVNTGGNEWKEIKNGDRQKLTDKEILELSELILKIENHYGFPCDIEWAREGGKFYIVQSRPITTLIKKSDDTDFPGNLMLANQDIDISWINLEIIWDGMLSDEIRKQVGVDFPKSLCEMKNGKTINLYIEAESLKDFINLSAKKVINDRKLLNLYKEKTIEITENIREYAIILVDTVGQLSDSQLLEILPKIKKMQSESMIYGCVVAFADIFGEITNKITEILSKRKKLKYSTNVYSSVLTFSEKTLTQKAYDDISHSTLSDDELIKKYFWLDQGYIGRGLTNEKLIEIKNHKIDSENLPSEKELLEELKLDEEERWFFDVAKLLIIIKSLRSDSRQFLNVVTSKIIDKISKKLNIEARILETLYIEELCKLLNGDKKVLESLQNRYEYSVFIANGRSDYKIIFGDEARSFLNKRILKTDVEKTNKILGQVANPGKITGIVKLVFGPQHINKVNGGDILVSTATSPQLLPAMKKAAAFVTDVGGITSHAAIVSRELKKPCIVGTKIATQALKDGDLIEVDADNGIINILEKKRNNQLEVDINKFSKLSYHYFHNRFRTPIYTYLLWEGLTHHHNKDIRFEYEISNMIDLDNDLASDLNGWNDLIKKINKYIDQDKNLLNKLMSAALKLNSDMILLTKKISKSFNKNSLAKDLELFFNKCYQFGAFNIFTLLVEKNFEEKMKNIIKNKFIDKEIDKIFQILTTPIELSAVQEKELDILKISKLKSNKLKTAIIKHIKRFAWLKNGSYNGDFYNYNDILEEVKKIKDPKKELFNYLSKLKIQKIEFEKYFNSFDKNDKQLISILLKSVNFRSWRTERFYFNAFQLDDLFRFLGLKFKLKDYKDIFYLTPLEILNLLKENSSANLQLIEERKLGYVMVSDNISTRIYSGDNVLEFKNMVNVKEKVESKANEISGQIAYMGKVVGKVRIVNNKEDLLKVMPGEIIVTEMTTPNFVPALKEARGIITNEGGITCHAAIIARELKKPCIIGTRVATQVLKDGDLVEVDADKGYVKLVKKADS